MFRLFGALTAAKTLKQAAEASKEIPVVSDAATTTPDDASQTPAPAPDKPKPKGFFASLRRAVVTQQEDKITPVPASTEIKPDPPAATGAFSFFARRKVAKEEPEVQTPAPTAEASTAPAAVPEPVQALSPPVAPPSPVGGASAAASPLSLLSDRRSVLHRNEAASPVLSPFPEHGPDGTVVPRLSPTEEGQEQEHTLSRPTPKHAAPSPQPYALAKDGPAVPVRPLAGTSPRRDRPGTADAAVGTSPGLTSMPVEARQDLASPGAVDIMSVLAQSGLLDGPANQPTVRQGTINPPRGSQGYRSPQMSTVDSAAVHPLASSTAVFEQSLRSSGPARDRPAGRSPSPVKPGATRDGPLLPLPTGPIDHSYHDTGLAKLRLTNAAGPEDQADAWSMAVADEQGHRARAATQKVTLAAHRGGPTLTSSTTAVVNIGSSAAAAPAAAPAVLVVQGGVGSMRDREWAAAVAASERTRAALEQRISQLLTELAERDASLEASAMAAARLQVSRDAMADELAQAVAAHQALQKRLDEALATIDETRHASSSAMVKTEAGAARTRAELIEAQSALKQAGEQLILRGRTAKAMRAEIDGFKGQLAEAQAALRALEEESRAEIGQLQEIVVARDMAVSDALGHADRMQAAVAELQAELQHYKTEVSVSSSARAAAEEETARLRAHVSEAARKLAVERQARALAERRAEALTRYVKSQTDIALPDMTGPTAAVDGGAQAPANTARPVLSSPARHVAGAGMSPARAVAAARAAQATGANASGTSTAASPSTLGNGKTGTARDATSSPSRGAAGMGQEPLAARDLDQQPQDVPVGGLEATDGASPSGDAATAPAIQELEEALRAARTLARERSKKVDLLTAKARELEAANGALGADKARLEMEVGTLKRRAEAAEARAAYLQGVLKGLRDKGVKVNSSAGQDEAGPGSPGQPVAEHKERDSGKAGTAAARSKSNGKSKGQVQDGQPSTATASPAQPVEGKGTD